MAVALRVGRGLSPALRTIALLYALKFVTDGAMWVVGPGLLHRQNVWVANLMLPVFTGLYLWAFSLWQERDVVRLTFRLAIPLFVATWAGLLLWAEDLNEFSRYASPLQALLLVCISAYTLVTASLRSAEPVWRQEWFWVSAAALLSYGSSAILTPLSALLLRTASMDQILRVFETFNGVDTVANLLTTGGMLCARPRPSSGGSFWRRSSWRQSSPPRSWYR